MDFRSDNVTVAAKEIIKALENVNHGTVGSYGNDPYTTAMNQRFADVFERSVAVIPVSTPESRQMPWPYLSAAPLMA